MNEIPVVLISGSRSCDDDFHREIVFDKLLGFPEEAIIMHGGAKKGADRFAHEWCEKMNRYEIIVRAKWHLYGKAAGAIRNGEMAEAEPDFALVFWDGKSAGAKDMIDKLNAFEIKSEVIHLG